MQTIFKIPSASEKHWVNSSPSSGAFFPTTSAACFQFSRFQNQIERFNKEFKAMNKTRPFIQAKLQPTLEYTAVSLVDFH